MANGKFQKILGHTLVRLQTGWLRLQTLAEDQIALIRYPDVKPLTPTEKFHKISSKKEQVSVLRAMAIRELIRQCVDKFMEEEQNILSGTFDKALTDHIPSTSTLEKIQAISIKKIYKSKPVIEKEIAGFEVLNGLLESFIPAVISLRTKEKLSWHHSSLLKSLPDDYYAELHEKSSMYDSLLVMLDFISGMTDSHALALYRNIKGISLPSG